MKFLVNDPRTKSALDKWSPGTIIAAVFIWNAGQPMQCNLKGVLCSLLHQILEIHRVIAMELMTDLPALSKADTHRD